MGTTDAPVFVLLLDDLNISPYRTHRAIRGALGIISAIPRSALVGVVTTSGIGSANLNLAHPDPSHEAQIRTLRGQMLVEGRAGDKLNFVTSGSSAVAASCGVGSANRISAACADPARAARRLGVLESVARSLARAGSRRKVLFWVTEDMGVTPLNPSEGQRAQRQALQAVLAADVAVYPVHPDELPFAPERGIGGTLMIGNTITGGSAIEMTADDYAAVTLDQMARESGGRWIVDINNHERVLADVVRQNSVSYLLAYESTSGTQAGRRRIDVRVARSGVRVYARRGYTVAAATTRTEAFGPATGPVATLSELLSSVVPHGNLELRVAAVPMLLRGTHGRALVTVGIGGITTDRQPVMLGMLTVNTEGVEANRRVLRMEAPPETGPWEVTVELQLSKGEHQLRIAAVTLDEKHQGLVALPVVMPGEPKALWMGTPMLLTRSGSNTELRPTTARDLPVGTPIAVSAQLSGRNPSSPPKEHLRLVERSGATRVEAEMAFEKGDGGNGGVLSGVLSTDSLPPGNYVVWLEAIGTKKNERVAQTLTITLVPGASGLAVASSKRMADGKEWMTANLNVNMPSSYCYEDAETNCRRYGRLYTWESAQRGCQSLGEGWRLPTDDEWRQMAKHYGGVGNDSPDNGKAAYKALLSGGASGFDALLGGNRAVDGQYERVEAHGFFWTVSENDPITAPFYNFGKGSQALYRQPQGRKQMAISVRCVRVLE